jgi:hypothetical protein
MFEQRTRVTQPAPGCARSSSRGAQAKPGCDSLGRHAQVPSKPSYRCCATATMATNSRGAVVWLTGGEHFGTCAHLHASMVAELVHAHMFVHAHDAEAFGGNTARRSAAELVSGRGPTCTCWGARRRHGRRIPAEDSSTKAGHRQDVHRLARWSTQASRVVAWTGNGGKKESKHVKFLAFTQNVEQVLGMPRLHLRHAFQGSGGQGKTKMSTARRPVSQAGKRGAKQRRFGDVLLTRGLEGFQGDAGSHRGRDGLAQCSAVQAGVRGSSSGRTTSYTESSTLASWAAGGHRAMGGTAVPPAWPPFTCGRRGQHHTNKQCISSG